MRLIDADDFIAQTRELYNQAGWGFRDIHYSQSAVEFNLSMMPTIDPVRYGRWVKMSDADGIFYGCSECGEWHKEMSNYCPNCGAKMDGGDYGTMAE